MEKTTIPSTAEIPKVPDICLRVARLGMRHDLVKGFNTNNFLIDEVEKIRSFRKELPKDIESVKSECAACIVRSLVTADGVEVRIKACRYADQAREFVELEATAKKMQPRSAYK